MPPSIKNLRRGVVVGAVALTVVLAIFLGLTRLKGHFRFDLPGRLGVDISQTANGFTYSQSQKGHTLFTIHASKLVQYKGDQAELHDVTITLCGPDGSGRSDKIYGSDFMYDRKLGLARATGAVRIDFSSPATRADGNPGSQDGAAPSGPLAGKQDGDTIHVLTSGVVFNQATGAATTEQRVDFVLARATGSAVGADYNAKDGVLVLGKEVALTTTGEAGHPATTTIHAEHAQLLRETRQAYLIRAEAISEGRRTTSDQATITFRPDGSAEQMNASGHVRLVTEDGAEVHASDALIDLDSLSRPLVANLRGGVTYHADDGKQTIQGSAVSGTLNFAAASRQAPTSGNAATQQVLKHAQFHDAVTFVLQQHSLAGDPNGSATRAMQASKVDVDFAAGTDGRSEAQHVLAVGGAMVTLHDVPSKGVSKSTSISGDQLLATLGNGRVFKVLDGKGNTRIVDSSSDGAISTSTGDTLHVTFQPGAAGSGASSGNSAQLDTAVQAGNVVLTQVPSPVVKGDPKASEKPGEGGPASPLHATAQRAEYDSGSQLLHLTGDPHLRNDAFALSADKVDYRRDSGDAAATGNVKSTYLPRAGQKGATLGGSGPVHIIADHAQLTRSSNVSTFYGTSTLRARIWQDGDAVEAPVLEFSRDQQTLDAHGDRGSREASVHATLGSHSGSVEGVPGRRVDAKAKGGVLSGPDQGTVPTRLTSLILHYSDKDRRADLHGMVTAEQPSGTVHADQVQVYLTPDVPGESSQLDHMVATGHVAITQPGRRGTGEKLAYTAADGRYVLTGTPSQPPRITDAQKGTTTGAALLFRTSDGSVEVSSHTDPVSPGTDPHSRTVTDTHTPK